MPPLSMPLRRRFALALVVLAVVLAHRWLLAPAALAPGRHGDAPARPLAMRVQVQRPEREPAPAPTAAAAPRPPPSPPRALPHPPATTAPAASAAAASAQPPEPLDAAELPEHPQGQPPEPAPPPADLDLRYRVARGESVGQGWLRFVREAEGGYTLTLRAQVPGMAELDWQSTGRLTPEGLEPLRLVERRQGRTTRAVNFQRDKGLISYSGPTRTDALRPAAQDRLSLLLQLPALVRAQPGRDEWAVQVAAPGGSADVWRFAVQVKPDATVLTREPERPYDWRVELVLAPGLPPWPQRMIWTLVPGGQPIEWTDAATP